MFFEQTGEVHQQALSIIKTRYSDFGPTFSHEKLTEQHHFHFSVETLRKWMVKDGLWLGKRRKKACIHQSRPRRSRLGELVQACPPLPAYAGTGFAGGSPAQAGEMRLQGINSIEQANAFLPPFIEDYNPRFSVPPLNPDNAHRALLHSKEERKLILSLHYQRKLSKNLTIQFHNTEYQLTGYGQGYRLHKGFNGSVTLLHKGNVLTYRTRCQGETAVIIADDKTVRNQVDQALHRQQQSTWKPAPDHPWRRPLTRSSTNTAP